MRLNLTTIVRRANKMRRLQAGPIVSSVILVLIANFVITFLFIIREHDFVSCDYQLASGVRGQYDEYELGKETGPRQLSNVRQVGGEQLQTSEHHYATKTPNKRDLSRSRLTTGWQPFEAPHLRLHGHRIEKRWAPLLRSRLSTRVQLAQRPPKSTTTTTTTSTTTSTTTPTLATTTSDKTERVRPASVASEEQEETSNGDDYEEIVPGSKAAKVANTAGSPPSSRQKGEEEGGAREQESAEEEEQEQEQEEEGQDGEEEEAISKARATTTTSTTTQKPWKWARGRKGRPKSKSQDESLRETGGEKKVSPNSKTGKPNEELQLEEDSGGQASSSRKGKQQAPETTTKTTTTTTTTSSEKAETAGQAAASNARVNHHKKKPLVALPFIKPKNTSFCITEAYEGFPRDFIGDKWRARGLVLIHVAIGCYMFYSLALVCERYFMPSLEEFAQRLQISEDVAGATLMSAGSSAPELFTAILGVFVAKGDVGTGTIVGSAVFNILFVIGLCAFVSTTSAQLQWWPVLRDSIYYTFTVLVLILIIYDERITALESACMIMLYCVYIAIMAHNDQIKESVTRLLLSYPITANLLSSNSLQVDGPDDVFGGGNNNNNNKTNSLITMANKTFEDDSIFMAALLIIIKHKRLFRSPLRFRSAARYIIIKRQHRALRQQQRAAAAAADRPEEVNYFGPENETLTGGGGGVGGGGGGGGGGGAFNSAGQRAKMEAYAKSASVSKQKFSIVSRDDYEFWHRPPDENENYYLWLARIPVNYVLHYTIPDCTLYPDKYVVTFVVSILWTALFSYVMVWMVTIIGYTLGIPDSVMGVTFLAAGTSVPDCYSSLHAARNGMADMAVSNSIGSNVFDILIGLAVPWFIQSAIYPGVVGTINSRGVIYSVILLFLSLIVTIYLLNKYDWSLQPRLGLALLIAYGLFIILTCMLEFNLFGHVNPPPC